MYISAIETAIGEIHINVSELFNDQHLIEKTGMNILFSTEKSTVELAFDACFKLKNKIGKLGPQLLVFVTQTPDDFLPAHSITLANKLELDKNLLSFDMNQGCSGFVQAFCILDKLTQHYPNVLLVTADRYRSKLSKKDRSTNAVFSDGATATLLHYSPDYGILYEDHITDGSKRHYLFQSTKSHENEGFLHMSGAEVWMFTKLHVVPQIEKAFSFCEEKQLSVKGVYIHQASKVVVDGIKNRFPDYKEKFYENYFKYGNTVSSSIPFLLKDYPMDFTHSNEVYIFAGFGVGLTSSVIVYGRKND